MKHLGKRLVPLACLLIGTACAPTRQPIPVGEIPSAKAPTTAEEQHGHQVLAGLTKEYELDYNHPRYQEVQRVVSALTKAAGADTHPWHVYLLKDSSFKNAGATRGNHIFLWTPMLDYTRNENELAGVLAHEISHVLSRHTDPDPNEDVRRLLINVGAMAAGVAAAQATNVQIVNTGQLAQQITSKVGEGIFLNPYSQKNEFEADQVGIFLMAKAKYDPSAAVAFWERAARDRSFDKSLSFFSTHPSSSARLEHLQKLLPRAQAVFEGKPQRTIDDSPQGSYFPSKRIPSNNRDSRPPRIRETVPNSDDSWDIRK